MLILTTPSFVDDKFQINTDYIEYIKRAGTPLVIPEFDSRLLVRLTSNRNDVMILLTGGADINPLLFGDTNYASMGVNSNRDTLELHLLEYAYLNNLPVFGICRGMQMMFYFLRNRISGVNKQFFYKQHIDDHNQGEFNIKGEFAFHRAGFKNHTRLVNSFHHQGVVTTRNNNYYEPINGFTPLAYCFDGKDTVLESFSYKNWFAVQWHPERIKNDELLTEFVGDL